MLFKLESNRQHLLQLAKESNVLWSGIVELSKNFQAILTYFEA